MDGRNSKIRGDTSCNPQNVAVPSSVSQFTLYADTRRGRRPGFTDAAPPAQAEKIYRVFADALAALGPAVGTGRFGAVMEVELVNHGPFTIWLDTADR